MGNDNAIYGIPYRACGVLRIDSKTDSAKIVGPNYGIGNYFWHGGIKCNGKIYGTFTPFTLISFVSYYFVFAHIYLFVTNGIQPIQAMLIQC